MRAPPRSSRLSSLALSLALCGCVSHNTQRAVQELSTLNHTEPLRVHLRDGTLVVFESWRYDDANGFAGRGVRYDAERAESARGVMRVPSESVVVVETTERALGTVGDVVVAMSVVTAASLGLTTACLINPKMCFGSCPTFYVRSGDGWKLQAEGFSTSIARALEASDLDDLPAARPDPDGSLRLEMRDEALETHFLRGVSLRVAEAPPGTTIQRTEAGTLAALRPLHPAISGDADPAVMSLLASRDAHEWTPVPDGQDLSARTAVTLRFAPPGSTRAGLVLTARNSLMNTWVFYHLLARLGREAPGFIAALERRDPAAHAALQGFRTALGGITVESRQGDAPWTTQGALGYQGPLAQGTRAVLLSVAHPDQPVEVRITFARAHWRLDAAELGAVAQEEVAWRRVAAEVEWPGRHDRAQAERALRGDGERLVTLPGDALGLRFATGLGTPQTTYFLETRGYYYEWLRQRWLADEDVADARALMADPAGALRSLAPGWSSAEPTMEQSFWQSRVAVGRGP